MDLPIALDTALKALLSCHAVNSWKITAEGPNPTVILRLRPAENQPSACHSTTRADNVSFKRKTPCQIHRDYGKPTVPKMLNSLIREFISLVRELIF